MNATSFVQRGRTYLAAEPRSGMHAGNEINEINEEIPPAREDPIETPPDGWPTDDEWPGETSDAPTTNTHTGFAPLDGVIIESEASRHSLAQIEAMLAHARAMAAEQPESPLHQQVVRDWLAIDREKRRMLGEAERRTA